MASKKRDFGEIVDTEKSFLGCIMQNSRLIYSVIDKISVLDFYNERHSRIYSAMLEFASQGIEFDVFKLQSYFQERNETFVCKEKYLFDINEEAPAVGVDFFSTQIKLNSNLRSTRKFLSRSLSMIDNEVEDIENILEEIDKNHLSLKTQIREESCSHLSGVADKKEEKFREGTMDKGIPTGFSQLDYYITGMKPKQMITIAAPTSMGKTAFALNVAVNVAKQGKSVLFFSLEMDAESLLDRIVCAETEIDSKFLNKVHLKTDEFNAVTKTLAKLRDLNIYIDDTGGLDVAKIRSRCQQRKMEKGGLDFVIIDYLQLINIGSTENRTIAVTNISNKIKQMASDLKIPVLCLAQLNRDVFKDRGEIELHHIRDSGSIEQDSDIVCFIMRKKKNGYDETIFKIAKNRNGETAKYAIDFIGKHYLFREFNKVDSNGIIQSSLF
ncbi:MAG: AAA family ATPase [Fibromonadaceae bacterium]|nr:AAA family ATPase [Fibromonadaceae bacterium]